MKKLTIALLKGGPSAEREVSLVSGAACAEALRSLGHQVKEIDVGRDVPALCRALDPKPDVVFNALHGRYGEDGCVQGILEFLGLTYTHSSVLASAMAMDKPLAKRLFAAQGIASPDGRVVKKDELIAGDPMARPFVVKPPAEGSSVGVRIVRAGDNLPALTAEGWAFGDEVLVERFIEGRELTVGVLGDRQQTRALTVTELRPKVGFYDYEAKYTDGKTEHLVPAPLPKAVLDEAMASAVAAHKVLGCRGVTRSDFRFEEKTGRLYILETNTQPGMTPLSLVPEQARYLDMDFPRLCQWMVEEALSR